MKARDRPLFLHSPSRPRNLQLFGMTVGRKEWAFADGLAKKGANQPFAAALQELGARLLQPVGGLLYLQRFGDRSAGFNRR